ncbi:MAG TPA: hypothetical protein VFF76_01195 [Holophagaceae bacterium]|jgi:hypothetical protein|nr:hypothetical protein [Holophagaceae bacterium]
MEGLVLDPALERARYESRRPFLAAQEALRAVMAPGIFLQPETAASVADQVWETLWAEGKAPETCDPKELAEVQASFAVLSPRREAGGWSLAATLMIGLPEEVRAVRLAELEGLPDQLRLELSDGRMVIPSVDRGMAPEGGRLPTVLALRWSVPGGAEPEAFLSEHLELSGRWPAPAMDVWALY